MPAPDLETLRVCFVAGTLGKGGAEQQLFYMLKALRDRGARPELLALTRGEYWEAPIRDLGVPVTWVGRRPSRLGRLAEIIAAVRSRHPDIVQSQHFYTNLYVVGAARAFCVKEICAIRSDVFREVAANGNLLGRMSLRAPRAIAANSRAAIRNAISFGVPAARLHFLPNVVDVTRFVSVPGGRDPSITLVAAGRMDPAKRFDRFLRLIARVRVSAPEVRLRALLVGAGVEEARLRRLASDLGLAPDVLEMTGAVDDMPSVYARGDVFVLTSDWEGTPNVVLEAMASGLPVVATAVGGVRDVVVDGVTGFVVDCANEDAMTEALLRLVADSSLRQAMGERARRHVEANFAVDRLPAMLGEIYGAALS
jgi:glycosyltransferase involved in cell wall biosynthesis